jgi:starch phosphorylase
VHGVDLVVVGRRHRLDHFHVHPNIPKELLPLNDFAMNLWFSWNWDAVQLFIRLDS